MTERELQNEINSLRAEVKRLRRSMTELTPPLAALLRRRGFKVYKKEPPDDLLIPEEGFIDEYYRFLNRYSFRLFLRDVIKHQELFTVKDVTRYATQEVTKDYVEYLLRIGLIEGIRGRSDLFCLKKHPVKSFGPTLEWFISEVFKREFDAEAIWGVKFKRPVVGGDYDLIAKVDGSILYMEVKSSPPKQIYANEVSAFLDRVSDLMPEIAVFFMDTELRMKDKIVPMFEDEIRNRAPQKIIDFLGTPVRSAEETSNLLGATETPGIDRMEKELFHIKNKIFIINAKDSIVNNIERVLIWHFRRL
ncbi:MAG: hypothetical protein OHK0032_14970 [Thermodesulfovibrionales bacterium]